MCMQDYMKIMEVNHQLQRRLCVCVCLVFPTSVVKNIDTEISER